MLLLMLVLAAVGCLGQGGLAERLGKMPAAEARVERVPVPEGTGYPSAAAMHPNGLIYVVQRNLEMAPVMAIDPKSGRVAYSFGKGMFQIPHAIRVHPDGSLYTVDAAASRVHQFTPEGRHVRTVEVGGQPKTESQFNGTTDIAFGTDGRMYVSDGYGNARVLIYAADGRLLRTFGRAGKGVGEFAQPHSVAVMGERLYVADRRNNRLQVFTLEGEPVAQWGHLGMVTGLAAGKRTLWVGTQSEDLPTSANGYLLEVDAGSGTVLRRMESRHAHHIVNLTPDGDPLTGARPDALYIFRIGKN
jgi:DNA-binding beta-propeller fold protein YncE